MISITQEDIQGQSLGIGTELFGSLGDEKVCMVAVWHLEARPDLGMEGSWQQSLGHIHWK